MGCFAVCTQVIRDQLMMLQQQFQPLVDDPITFLDRLFQTKVRIRVGSHRICAGAYGFYVLRPRDPHVSPFAAIPRSHPCRIKNWRQLRWFVQQHEGSRFRQ
jgi:hypothetical protein